MLFNGLILSQSLIGLDSETESSKLKPPWKFFEEFCHCTQKLNSLLSPVLFAWCRYREKEKENAKPCPMLYNLYMVFHFYKLFASTAYFCRLNLLQSVRHLATGKDLILVIYL